MKKIGYIPDIRVIPVEDWSRLKYNQYDPIAQFFVALFYMVIIYYILSSISRRFINNYGLKKHFIYGWIARVFGGIFIYAFYIIYYGGGDIVCYINDLVAFSQLIYEIPFATLEYITISISQKDFYETLFLLNDVYYFLIYQTTYRLIYIWDYNSEMVAVFSIPMAILGLGTEYTSLIIISTVSFLGSWLIYLTFLRYYPRYRDMLAIPFLYLPSLNLWTGAPFKETYAIIGSGLLVYGVYEMLHKRRFWWLPLSGFGVWMAYTVKPYVALSILPWVAIWIHLSLNKKIKHVLYRYFFSPLIFVFFTLISYHGILFLGEDTGKYSIENIPKQAHIVYTDLQNNPTYYTQTGGSVYNLGDFEPTVQGMLSKFPIATLTGMFRPFLWESNKPVILMSALETFVLLVITLINMLRHGVISIIKKSFSHPFLAFSLGYSIFFLFMTGLTSGNFGNLVRYRLPGYIFFFAGLFVIFGMLRDESYHRRRREQRAWGGARSRPAQMAG